MRTRRKRAKKGGDVSSSFAISKENETIAENSTKNQEEKERYPDPQQEEQELLKKSEEYLKKERKREIQLTETIEQDVPNDEREVKKEKISPRGPRMKKGKMIWIVFILLAYVFGIYVGFLMSFHQSSGSLEITDRIPKAIQKDLAVYRLEVSSKKYGVSFSIDRIVKHGREWNIYVSAKNESKRTVYFMASSMKLVSGRDVVLPDLTQGRIPSTFTGFGLPPGASDSAVIVFKVPENVHPKHFLIENITNMKNPIWSLSLNL